MPTNPILFSLQERFSAPLPEFHHRRIIFWHDEDREFEVEVDGLELPGVNIVKLTGANNFAVKKLLLHDDLETLLRVITDLIFKPARYDFRGIKIRIRLAQRRP